MTFLAPWWLAVAAGAALAAVALHLLARQRPPSAPLPTTRFIPPGAARATALATRPADVALLALRVGLLLLAGAALARPVWLPDRRPLARVVAVDVSRSVGDPADAADRAAALLSSGDLVVAFDSAPHAPVVWTGRDGRDRLMRLADSVRVAGARGSLSAALVAGMRAAAMLRDDADSVELVLISPFALEELDEATLAIRDRWAGGIRLVQVEAARALEAGAGGVDVRAPADDPVVAAAALARHDAWRAPARIVRDTALVATDTAWARAGGVLVHWPVTGAPAAERWAVRARRDTAGAVAAGQAVVVAAFARGWQPRASDEPGVVLARWPDGEPAAIERRLGAGCVREVAVPVPAVGDVAIRPPFARVLAALAAPCTHVPDETPAAPHVLASLRRTGLPALASTLPAPREHRTPLAALLLGAALLLALIELALRRGRSEP